MLVLMMEHLKDTQWVLLVVMMVVLMVDLMVVLMVFLMENQKAVWMVAQMEYPMDVQMDSNWVGWKVVQLVVL